MPPRVEAADAAALVARLQAHSADPEVQAECCWSLCGSGLLTEEAALSFVPATVAALRAHPGHARLQMNGCAALGFIFQKRSADALASAAGAADGVRAVVAALRAHPANAQLQSSCCGVLNTLSRHAWLRETAVNAGAVQLVVAALHAHVLYDAGVSAICNAIGRITVDHPLALAQAGAAGAVAAAVAALCAHPASAVLHTTGCYALASLASDDNNRTEAIQAGAIEAIVLALRAHAADVSVQAFGCSALANVAVERTDAIDARSDTLLLDATKAAVAALNAHCANARVTRAACLVVNRLLITDAHRVEAAKIGAVTAVIAALHAHPADASTQQAACGATSSLCAQNSANAVQACGAGALQALVAGLRAHAAVVSMQTAGCDALSCLVNAHPRLQAAAGAAGAVEATVDAMRTPAAAAQLQRTGCSALLSMVRGHCGNAERACAADVMDALAVIMSTSYAHEATASAYSVYDCAVFLLDALMAGHNGAAQSGIHAGVLDILVREGTTRNDPSVIAEHARVVQRLQAAAQLHDAAICMHAGCKRCATARDAGGMCALPGCGARKRDGGKKLNRCGACRAACYCGPAHQREDWARHKDECAALRAASEAAEQQPDE
jgi:hypothetical protein